MLQEFKKFALRGSVVDLAIGVIIGAAFGKIVDSLVKDIIMPLVGGVIGKPDFSNWFIMLGTPPSGYNGPMTYEALTKAGVPLLAYGNFITITVNFILIACVLFMIVKGMNRLVSAEQEAPPPKPPTREEELLAEIRDLLKSRS